MNIVICNMLYVHVLIKYTVRPKCVWKGLVPIRKRERVDEFKIRPGCIRVVYTEYIYDL